MVSEKYKLSAEEMKEGLKKKLSSFKFSLRSATLISGLQLQNVFLAKSGWRILGMRLYTDTVDKKQQVLVKQNFKGTERLYEDLNITW